MTDGWTDARLGTDDSVHRVTAFDDARLAHRMLAEQARRTLRIVSRDLDARLYDDPPFLEAVRALATSSRYARIEALVQDPEPAVKRDHRLIELTRRLSSFIEVRVMGEDFKEFNEAFLVADERGYYYRSQADRPEGELCFNGALRARELTRVFNDIWQVSEVDAQFRRLHI